MMDLLEYLMMVGYQHCVEQCYVLRNQMIDVAESIAADAAVLIAALMVEGRVLSLG